MYKVFRRIMLEKGWARPGMRLVVGVSGGIDSMVLLDLLRRLSREISLLIVAAHLNHGLRGEEAERDERFVTERCARWKIPVESEKRDVKGIARKTKDSIQVAARKVRYEYLNEVMERYKGDYLVLGHQADDVAETVLIRFLRGASVQGLSGILEQNGRVIRPLLSFSRIEILSYAQEEGIPYVEDSSNEKGTYLRNRVRHELIPHVTRMYQPAFPRHLLRYAQYFGEIHAYISEVCREIEQEVVRQDGSINVPFFQKLPITLQRAFLETYLLKRGWMEDALSFNQLSGIIKMLAAPGGMQRFRLKHGLWLVREYDRLFVVTEPLEIKAIHPVSCGIPGSIEIKEIGNRLHVEEVKTRPEDFRSNKQEAYVEGDRIGHFLWVRSFRPGDRIETTGDLKLKKLLIDAKIPRSKRRLIPLIGSGDDILWVAGMCVNHRYFVSDSTRRVLRLWFEEPLRMV